MSGATPDQLDELKVALSTYKNAAKELAEKKPIIDKLGVDEAMQSVGGVVDGAGHTHTVLGSYSNQIGSGSSVINNSSDPTKTAYNTFVRNFLDSAVNTNALTNALAAGPDPPFPSGSDPTALAAAAKEFVDALGDAIRDSDSPFDATTFSNRGALTPITTAVVQSEVETAIKNVEKDKIQENLENLFTPPARGGKKRTRKARKARKAKKSKKSKKRLPSKKRKARKSMRKH